MQKFSLFHRNKIGRKSPLHALCLLRWGIIVNARNSWMLGRCCPFYMSWSDLTEVVMAWFPKWWTSCLLASIMLRWVESICNVKKSKTASKQEPNLPWSPELANRSKAGYDFSWLYKTNFEKSNFQTVGCLRRRDPMWWDRWKAEERLYWTITNLNSSGSVFLRRY